MYGLEAAEAEHGRRGGSAFQRTFAPPRRPVPRVLPRGPLPPPVPKINQSDIHRSEPNSRRRPRGEHPRSRAASSPARNESTSRCQVHKNTFSLKIKPVIPNVIFRKNLNKVAWTQQRGPRGAGPKGRGGLRLASARFPGPGPGGPLPPPCSPVRARGRRRRPPFPRRPGVACSW